MDFGTLLGGVADSLGRYLGSQSAAELQAQRDFAAQNAQARAAELQAQTSQTAFKYGALAIGLIVVVVLLSRNKVL